MSERLNVKVKQGAMKDRILLLLEHACFGSMQNLILIIRLIVIWCLRVIDVHFFLMTKAAIKVRLNNMIGNIQEFRKDQFVVVNRCLLYIS